MRIERVWGITVAGALAGGACGAPETAAYGPWDGVTSTEGAVTTTINRAGAAWAQPARLVEELSIGVEEGPEEYMFGSVFSVATDPRGRIVVLDRSLPTVRVYDSGGKYLHDIGGRGQGPGEYESPMAVGIAEDGTIFVRDGGRRRISRYAENGRFLASYPLHGTMKTPHRLVITAAGTPFTIGDLDFDSVYEMVPYGPRGPIDDARRPPDPGFDPWIIRGPGPPCTVTDVPYAPAHEWAMGRDERIVTGVSERYSFRVLHRDGSEVVVEHYGQATEFMPEERDYRRRYAHARDLYACGADWTWDGPELPAHKPAYFDFLPVTGGGTWVLRHGPSRRIPASVCETEPRLDGARPKSSCWQDTYVVDAFDARGRYLGVVLLPEALAHGIWNLRYPAELRENRVLTPVVDRDGTVRVKRYRVQTEPGEP